MWSWWVSDSRNPWLIWQSSQNCGISVSYHFSWKCVTYLILCLSIPVSSCCCFFAMLVHFVCNQCLSDILEHENLVSFLVLENSGALYFNLDSFFLHQCTDINSDSAFKEHILWASLSHSNLNRDKHPGLSSSNQTFTPRRYHFSISTLVYLFPCGVSQVNWPAPRTFQVIFIQSFPRFVEFPTSSCYCHAQTIANELLDFLLLYWVSTLFMMKFLSMILDHS